MRALASAIILLTATCFGQGVGPLAVGMINDALKNDYGANAVRYSLLSAAVTTTLGALLFVWAARSIGATSSGRPEPKRYREASPTGRSTPKIRKSGRKTRPTKPFCGIHETIPKQTEAYISCQQTAHRRLGGIT